MYLAEGHNMAPYMGIEPGALDSKSDTLPPGYHALRLKSYLDQPSKPQLVSNLVGQHKDMSCCMGKPTICICENKDADQLRGNREADQRLCFRYSDSTISLLSKCKLSGF